MFKLTAYQRIEVLTDHGSFEEVGAASKNKHSDSAVTGFATVNGRQVFIIAINTGNMGGSLGEVSARKINHLLDMALQYKAPVVTLFESVGARIQEGVIAMHHLGMMFRKFAQLSGVVPTIAVQFGVNSGATAYSAGLMDIMIMVENASCSFITGPKVIEAMIGEKISNEELGGTSVHGPITGLAAFIESNEYNAIQKAKDLLQYLPQHCFEEPGMIKPSTKKKEPGTDLCSIIPVNHTKQGYDMSLIIKEIIDDHTFMELYSRFAPNLITGFAKLGGATIGIAANQPLYLGGILDVDSCRKLFRFIQICDAYSIPMLFIADSPGFMPGREQEHASMLGVGARVLSILSNSTIPKITLIVNKIIGGAYGGMSSRGLGADLVYVWPTAHISTVGSKAAMSVLYRKEMNISGDHETARGDKMREFEEKHITPYTAAEHGQIDAIIHPNETRKVLIKGFISLRDKAETPVNKRRTILPM